jgi:phospholipid/cholesterol/gamma-HCH transport system ATP-binding protein
MDPTLAATAETEVSVRDLTMRFGRKVIHEHVDLDVYQGEILAIVGGSGTGKTTLLREMVLLQHPTSGSVRVLGEEISGLSEEQVLHVRRRIGVLFQNGALFGGLNVMENVGAPLREHTALSRKLIDEIACVKLSLVGLTPRDGLLYPSSGLDPLSADAFDELVLDLKAALDPTIVLVTHDMDTLWRVADRVVLLGEGKVLAEGGMLDLARSSDPAVVRFFHGPRGRAAQAST